MRIPDYLEEALSSVYNRHKPSSLVKAQETLSSRYLALENSDEIFGSPGTRAAYIATRSPAIYGVILKVLEEFQKYPGAKCETLLDLGSGPGTATWAAFEMFPEIKEALLFERSGGAILLGKEIAKELPFMQRARFIPHSLDTPYNYPKADVAILSYVLGELEAPERLLSNLWNQEITTLILVEPGTPRGFGIIRRVREHLIGLGAALIAPCPHSLACPMREKDWCHFAARIERTKLHREVKRGTLGYEDEKYSYLIATKLPKVSLETSRILRNPEKNKGHVRLTLCTPEGEWKERVVSKKDSLYKAARKADWGDSL